MAGQGDKVTNTRSDPFGTAAVGSEEPVSRNVSSYARGLSSGVRSASLTAVWSRVAPSIPLLLILGAYTLISLVVRKTGGDEAAYLRYARNLIHGFYAQTQSMNRANCRWHCRLGGA